MEAFVSHVAALWTYRDGENASDSLADALFGTPTEIRTRDWQIKSLL